LKVGLTLALIFFVTIPLVGFLIYLGTRRAREQFLEQKALRTNWARGHGLQALDPPTENGKLSSMLDTEAGKRVLKEFAEIKPLARRTTKAYNLFEGTYANHAVKLFETRHEESSGESTTYYYGGVVSVSLTRQAPRFELRAHRAWDKVGAWFGSRDVELGRPSVDEKLYVTTDNTIFLSSLIDEEAESYLLNDRIDTWHCLGDRLVVVRRQRSTEADFDQMLTRATRIAQKAESLLS